MPTWRTSKGIIAVGTWDGAGVVSQMKFTTTCVEDIEKLGMIFIL